MPAYDVPILHPKHHINSPIVIHQFCFHLRMMARTFLMKVTDRRDARVFPSRPVPKSMKFRHDLRPANVVFHAWYYTGMLKLAISLLLLGATAAFAVPKTDAQPATTPLTQTAAERIVGMARQIVEDLKQSVYAHQTDIDESKDIYNCDCSGLVDFILQSVAPEHFKQIAPNHHHRPLAVDFYDTFVHAPTTRPTKTGWQQINRIEDVLPGDVLAWKKLDRKPGDTTGHVVIINSPAMREGDNLVRLEIIDSTTAPHADDTRPKGHGGVGEGTVWFDIDDSGQPLAIHSHNRDTKPLTVPISIGRPVGPATQTP